MALSGLDGFLTAVVIAPDRIPPSEWLPVIWGDEEPEFESEAELRTILATIMGRYSQIATCFSPTRTISIRSSGKGHGARWLHRIGPPVFLMPLPCGGKRGSR